MNRFLIPVVLLVSSAPAAEPPRPVKPRPVAKVAAQVQAVAPVPAPPPAPAEAPLPIPFAPLGPPPFGDAPAQPQAQPAAPNLAAGAVSVEFEEGTLRFLVFDERGWLPDVKQIQMTVSVGARSLELTSYPGPYAPSAPEVRRCELAKMATLAPAEFQARLDEVSRGAAPQNGVAAK